MQNSKCRHQWQKVHEEALFGGTFPIGYQCKVCNEFVNINDVPLKGLPGVDTKEHALVGPHGGKGHRADGSTYSRQIYYPNGKLEVIP